MFPCTPSSPGPVFSVVTLSGQVAPSQDTCCATNSGDSQMKRDGELGSFSSAMNLGWFLSYRSAFLIPSVGEDQLLKKFLVPHHFNRYATLSNFYTCLRRLTFCCYLNLFCNSSSPGTAVWLVLWEAPLWRNLKVGTLQSWAHHFVAVAGCNLRASVPSPADRIGQ